MPSPDDVSVIVCTRNRPEHLRKALTAIFARTPAETEVIVVDSASDTDETHEIAVSHGATYVRAGKGLSVARNAGITSSSRPIVVFTDDDCLPAEGWITELLPHFANPRNGAVTGRMLHHTASAADAPYHRRALYRTPLEGLDAGHGAIMAFRREQLLRLGGFDDIMGAGQRLAGAEDLDIFVRIIRGGSQIVHEQKCIVMHDNTRVGQEYIALHRGYGLGLGALVGKWLRIDPKFGFLISWRLLGRTITRIVRAELRGAPSAHDRALLGGIFTGISETKRLPIVGERFVPEWAPARVPVLTQRPEEHMAAPANTAPAGAPVSVELLRILDETHLATSLQYEAMHTGCVLLLEGSAITTSDGLLDREKLLAAVDRGARRVPALSTKVLDSPLGITAPAWVPDDDFDVRRHVYFNDEPQSLTGDRLRWFTDGGRGPLPKDRPLWDITFTRLDTGKVAMGCRLHHASGDGKWSFETLTEITEPSQHAVPVVTAAEVRRAPRTRLTIPLYAARTWLRDQPTVTAAWREYWRKPIVKRIKRVGGRNTRPIKEFMIRRRNLRSVYLPPTSHAYFELDASQAARRAAKLRGSLNDLLVAGAMRAVDDDQSGIDVLVPVSRRTKGDRAIRNHVSMTRVHGDQGAALADLVASVRTHVAAFATGKDLPEPPVGRAIGYATLVPWSNHKRWFAGAEVESIVVVPANDPRDELSAFGAVYGDKLIVTVITRAELDTDGGAARLREALAGVEG